MSDVVNKVKQWSNWRKNPEDQQILESWESLEVPKGQKSKNLQEESKEVWKG